jgi:hypothetical protein
MQNKTHSLLYQFFEKWKMAESTSSIKLLTWDGKATTFSVFWLRFKAYAVVKKFLPALQDSGEDNLPSDEAMELDPDDDDDDKL